MHFGAAEILLILVAVFLLFGASRLPQLAKSLAHTRKAFREGLRESDEVEKRPKAKENTLRPKVAAAPVAAANFSDEDLLGEIRRRASSR